MNLPKFHSIAALVSGLSLAGLAAPAAIGQTTTATTDPVGVVSLPLLANSDTFVSIPFTQPPTYVGAIQSISGSTITLAGTPGWGANQFQYVAGSQPTTYYAIIGPNTSALTGAVNVTNGSATVTGTGTTFTTQLVPGDELLVNGLAYNVQSIQSDTSLTLSRAYTGTSSVAGTPVAATFDHSPKEGAYYTVTSNGANTLTVNLNGDSLSAVAANTSVSLIPYWTLGTAFPPSAAGVSFTTSASAKSRGTQILLPDLVDAGINLAPKVAYYNLNGAWRQAGGVSTTSYDDVILPPSTYFIVRNASTATTFTPSGGVYMNRITITLDTQSSGSQDNAVAVSRPASVTLNDLGLIASGAFAASPSVKQRTDLLLTYDNTVSGINKAATAGYYFYNGAWRLAGAPDSSVDYGSTVVPYGVGLTVRKAANGSGSTAFWQNVRNY